MYIKFGLDLYKSRSVRTVGSLVNHSQYSLRGLMIVIVTGFIPLSPLYIVLTVVMLESSQWLGKNTVSKNFRKAWIGALAAAI